MYYLSVLCKSFKERFFFGASRSKADAKVLLFSEPPKLFRDIFGILCAFWRKTVEMKEEKYVLQHKNGECGRKRRKDVYLIILYAREGRMGLMGLMGRGATGIAEPDFLPGWGKSLSGQGKKNFSGRRRKKRAVKGPFSLLHSRGCPFLQGTFL